ncbi:MAG: CoA pyrophosphatase [candidate division KSB1 bacterium]|nr:CoA pyrophosphatase [candidate division KSB1 bacterium]MDZ7274880.1 CoA pyrophosphatase [candidate division KSB1 bacterium]MDZ7286668.1 CoA pyrophosphatase [candidate division KSB1 bacterium]MDZ7299169.1 CoA pyrophosphatase [candidate division KSB1 bacterium]MDZ7307021.1 CoA pyrophosphatase [candidate division KSB1 bacterium]
MNLPLHELRRALQTVPPRRREPVPGLQHSAVLAILFEADVSGRRETQAVFIMKTSDGSRHGGQIAFPGGRLEPHDRSLLATALRETHEEIGVAPAELEVLGTLGHFSTMTTGFDVAVYVARPLTPLRYAPQHHEVAAIFEVPMRLLFEQFDPGLEIRSREDFLKLHYHVAVAPHLKFHHDNWPQARRTICIWGFTARVLHHFMGLIRRELRV